MNNTAEVAGTTLFGGNTDDDPSNIASEPTRVCPCENSIPNCNLTSESVMVNHYPGKRYEFEAVAVGQNLALFLQLYKQKSALPTITLQMMLES